MSIIEHEGKSRKTILLKAAEFIRKGWTRGALKRPAMDSFSGVDEYCLLGAIHKANGGRAFYSSVGYEKAQKIIGWEDASVSPYQWNDSVASQEKVAKALEEMAETGLSWDEYYKTKLKRKR